MTDPIRVVIADDHPVFLDGLRGILASAPDIVVVAEASTGEHAVDASAATQPDVVVIDLRMPDLNGIEATQRIVHQSPHVGVLVLTMLEDDASVFAAMRAGARGYLLKGANKAEIVRAVHAIASGEAIFGPAIAQRVIEYFSTPPLAEPPQAFPELTARERDVLDLIAQGINNDTIARHLSLSPKTIRNQVSNIFTKLQVADRAQAIVRARDAGLGRTDAPGPGLQ
jgi:DNA-binding NarL/FixJ family response regulator